MKSIYKKRNINFLGFTVSIRITYTPTHRIQYSKLFAPVFIILLIISIFAGAETLYSNPAYATESSPLLEKISPSLSQISENNVPTPPVEKDDVVLHGPTDKKQVALTFDADMTPEMKKNLNDRTVESYYDKRTIEVLNNTNTKATLFLSGMWIEQYPAVTEELAVNSLFELANHSYSHPSFDGFCYGLDSSSDDQDKEEIEKTQKLLKEVGGTDNKYFRFPGGCYSKGDLAYVKNEGLVVVHWDVAGQDGFNKKRELIEKNIIDNVKNGSIIVLHMNGYPSEPETANALPKIISAVKGKGFQFVKVSELIAQKKLEATNIRDFIKSDFGL